MLVAGLDLPVSLLYACLVSIGGCLLGVLGLFLLPASVERAQRHASLLAFALAGLSGAAALLGKPWLAWAPTLTVSAGWLLGQLTCLVRGHVLVGRLLRLLDHARGQVVLLLAVSPLVLVGLLLPPPEANVRIHRSAHTLPASESAALTRNQTVFGLTDLDTRIPLLFIGPQEESELQAEIEKRFIAELTRDNQLIVSAPADPGHNCHGWVFAAGRYWVDGTDVPRILNENGYQPVSQPHPGDLVVYRNAAGAIIHTGLVRVVTDEGLVLVESKWGHLGRYVHPADKVRFTTSHGFYRSSRPGHLLHGLPGTSPTDQPTSHPGI